MMQARFGMGAYSLAEAGRLLNVTPTTIDRWLFGYEYKHSGKIRSQPPLWRPQYGAEQDEPILGFRDLIEARIVRGLRAAGLGLPTIRACLQTAAAIVKDDHPFSTRSFKTDGQRLFLETIAEDDGDVSLLDLRSRQMAFKRIVEQTFVSLEFDADIASRWWLLPGKRTIVADPERSFGQPIEASIGVPTARLAQAVEAEGSATKVAAQYEIPVSYVRDALRFERMKRERLAA